MASIWKYMPSCRMRCTFSGRANMRNELRALQAPLKKHYREQPETARMRGARRGNCFELAAAAGGHAGYGSGR
jgi:hypothetical protein